MIHHQPPYLVLCLLIDQLSCVEALACLFFFRVCKSCCLAFFTTKEYHIEKMMLMNYMMICSAINTLLNNKCWPKSRSANLLHIYNVINTIWLIHSELMNTDPIHPHLIHPSRCQRQRNINVNMFRQYTHLLFSFTCFFLNLSQNEMHTLEYT